MASSSDRIKALKPLRSWVLIKIDKRPEKVGSIHLPDTEVGVEKVQEKSGRIVAMGEGKLLDNGEYWIPQGRDPETGELVTLSVGHRVLFRGFYGDVHHSRLFAYFDGDDEYTFLHMESCLTVLGDDVEIGHLNQR